MRSGVIRIRARRRRRWRITSCAAANGIRWVKPSMATLSPSRMVDSTASARVRKRDMPPFPDDRRFIYGSCPARSNAAVRYRECAGAVARRAPSRRTRERLTAIARNVTERIRPSIPGIAVSSAKSASGFDVELPRSLQAERRDAIDDPTVAGIEAFFAALPDGIKAVVLKGEGEHFCAGLDLGELTARGVAQGIAHSRSWHRAFERIEFGKVPVVAVLHGAVVGGGLEIAAACHIRVAERSAYYALPEGSRGIYVGGGGSVRLPRLIGVARMMDMMLTGRTYSAEEGQAIGLST